MTLLWDSRDTSKERGFRIHGEKKRINFLILFLLNCHCFLKTHTRGEGSSFKVKACLSLCVFSQNLTDGEAVAEVMKPVPHDDHPGQRGHARLLEVLLGVGVGVAVRVVVLGVVVVQDVVVVVVVVVHAVGLAHRVMEVGVALVLAVLRRVSGGGAARPGVTLRRDHGHLWCQHHLLLL